jgi:hypothetical protein
MENQILAKSLAPRTPYLLTIGVCVMSRAFINSVTNAIQRRKPEPATPKNQGPVDFTDGTGAGLPCRNAGSQTP